MVGPPGPTVLAGRSDTGWVLLFLAVAGVQALEVIAGRSPSWWGWVRIGAALAIAVAALGWWLRIGRFRRSIAVDAEAIRVVRDGAAIPEAEILRHRAPIHLVGVGRTYRSGFLAAQGSPAAIGLEGFDNDAVLRACAAHGWPIGAPVRLPSRRVEWSDLLP